MSSSDAPGSGGVTNAANRTAVAHPALPIGNPAGITDAFADATTERWYLRIDDKEYGPVTRAQMEFFLRPPRLCSHLQIMCSAQEGTWHSIARNDSIEKVISKFGLKMESSLPVTHPSFDSSRSLWLKRSGNRIGSFVSNIFVFLVKHRLELSGIAALIVIDAVYVALSSRGVVREREILRRYESIWKVAREFDPDENSSDEWQEFAKTAISNLHPLLKELQRTASAKRPARQILLFAGREHLLKILDSPTPASIDSDQAELFERKLKTAQHQLSVFRSNDIKK